MKFIKTITGAFINVQDIYKVDHELDRDSNFYYSYFYLRNSEKFDVFDCPKEFILDDKVYDFDADCHMILNAIILYMINLFDMIIFDMDEMEGEIWETFLSKMAEKLSNNSEKIKVDSPTNDVRA